jgi:ribosomal protein S27E
VFDGEIRLNECFALLATVEPRVTCPERRLCGHVPLFPLPTTTRNTSRECRILRSPIGWSRGHLSFSRRRERSVLLFLSKTQCEEACDNQQAQQKKDRGCEPEGKSQDECVNCFNRHIVFAHEFFLLIPCPACGHLTHISRPPVERFAAEIVPASRAIARPRPLPSLLIARYERKKPSR